MSRSQNNPGLYFWTSFAARVVGIVLVGLASILVFRDVVAPALKRDIERVQEEHRPTSGPGFEPAR